MSFLLRLFVAVLALAGAARAGDLYYEIPLGDLDITEGKLPDAHWPGSKKLGSPYVVLDGGAEAYLAASDRSSSRSYREAAHLLVRAPERGPVAGLLVVPDADGRTFQRLRFHVRAPRGFKTERQRFDDARATHYRRLLDRGGSGAAWYRHQWQSSADPESAPERRGGRRRGSSFEDTFALFTGGRAISENLQLDREMPDAGAGESAVPLEGIAGITVAAIDWAPYVKGLKVEPEPLAAFVPADQYAVLFPSFQAMLDLIETADDEGTPLLHWIEPRAEDALTRQRYERQLAIRSDLFARLLGPALVKSVTFTGSDPYLRTGSDVALLLEAVDGEQLFKLVAARRKAAAGRAGVAGVREVSGRAAGTDYHAYVSPRRRVSSYLARRGTVVVLSNSLVQLTRVLEAAAGSRVNLAGLDEYTFFRGRYPRGADNETALLILPDAAIRKWCGPRWRIGASRRVRAASALAEATAAHLDRLVAGVDDPVPVKARGSVDLGNVRLEKDGVASSVYNTLGFLTPIAELEFDRVSRREDELYRRWRDGYQRNWSGFFDPIAIRVALHEDRLAVDATVMPLIALSEYKGYLEVARGAKIRPDAGDRHPGSLFHLAFAIDADSEPVRDTWEYMKELAPGMKGNPLSWLGESYALYLDRDPAFLRDLIANANELGWLLSNFNRIPIALHCEVKDEARLREFLGGLRKFMAQWDAAWETRKHKERSYVRVGFENPALHFFYAVTPDSFVITLREDVLMRALDRAAARKPAHGRPWLGAHLCLQADRELVETYDAADRRTGFVHVMRRRSYENVSLLNEWKRRYPAHDPVALHERFWKTRIVCPGGGRYAWNERWQTMESTTFGHLGAPRPGAGLEPPYAKWRSLNGGVTFEGDGLRARFELMRDPGSR